MTIAFPSTPPPPSLYPKLLPHLISQLSSSTTPTTTLPLLRATLQIQASVRLAPAPAHDIPSARSTVPLERLIGLASSQPSLLKVPLLLDGIIAYPLHVPAVNQLLAGLFEKNPDLIEVFRIDVVPSLIARLHSAAVDHISKSGKILLSLIRAHDELLALALEDSEDALKALSKAYETLSLPLGGEAEMSLSAKSDILMICRELVGRVGHGASEEIMLRFMGSKGDVDDTDTGILAGGGLRNDWEALFGSASVPGTGLGEDVKGVLVAQRDQEARQDPRVQPILQLFPLLPPHLLLSALSHEVFTSLPSGSKATPSEQAAPLLESILNQGEGLPTDLAELRDAITSLAHENQGMPAENEGAGPTTKAERRNIWDDEELDVGRLRLKDDDSSLPSLSTTIPDHLRASIMRLVENQAEEEEERRRALRDANLLDDDEDDYEENDGVLTRIKVGSGSGDDDESEELDEGDAVKISREPSSAGQSRSGPSDRQRLDLLRTTYITNPSVFERDGATRRSNERKKLREVTGWDDGQIEGWRIMLERDPHKETILAAHAERMAKNRAETPSNNGNSDSSRGGRSGRGSGSGSGGGRGGGGGGGGRGGGNSRGGGGGGGGRGGGGSGGRGGSKSSRGHTNAARTRGHDKKMGRMGAI